MLLKYSLRRVWFLERKEEKKKVSLRTGKLRGQKIQTLGDIQRSSTRQTAVLGVHFDFGPFWAGMYCLGEIERGQLLIFWINKQREVERN